MRAVILGPGRIGCGFAGHLLHESGYELTFLAREPVMVEHLNRVRGYRLSLSDGGADWAIRVRPGRWAKGRTSSRELSAGN